MSPSARDAPPFSPVLLAGLALRPLPPVLFAPGLAIALSILHRRHPDLFERLAGIGAARILIDPIDLPFCLLLEIEPERPRLSPLRRRDAEAAGAQAAIRGPLSALVDLLEGRLDCDALFFSRRLRVEGDTEAVVALRNAIDDAELDLLGEALTVLGPLAGPGRAVARLGAALAHRAAEDLAVLRASLLGPAERRIAAQAAEIEALREELAALKGERGARRTRSTGAR
jgi:O2-independent ubiquinone biosynthesis accessory factor UbiT